MSDPGGEEGSRTAVRDRVDRLLSEHEVVLFLQGDGPTPRCRFSRRALELVECHRDEFATVDVGEAADTYRDVLSERSDWATIPQAYVDGEFVGDGDVMAALADRGELRGALGAD